MSTTVGQHSVSAFTSPINGTSPIDANQVRGNDNTIRTAFNTHDSDAGIHLQSSDLASRPAAGQAGRKWVTADAGSYKLWYDDGSRWHEVGNDHIEVEVIAEENIAKGDVVEVVGYNPGLNIARVQKTTSQGPAFAIANEAISTGNRGYVINTGIIFGIDTTNYGTSVEPSILYTATGGTLTSTKPASGIYQASAYLLRHQQNNGVLYVEFSAPAIVERSDNTAGTVVLRDGSGNFSAGTVTANLTGNVTGNVTGSVTGNADTATKLSSNRTFDLTGNVTGTVSSDLNTGFSIATTIANDVITNAMISPTAAIAYSKLALTDSIVNADIATAAAIADTKLATIATAGKVSNSATTATSSNVSDAIVARDSSGDFSAGTITAALTGNASTATALQNVRTLWGQNFDGTANVSGELTGVTDITASGTITATSFSGSVASATTADKLSSARTLALTGNVTGSTSSDLDTGFSISTTIANDTITNAMVNTSAAIAYTKLALSNSIVNADINASAAIAYSKLALTGSIVDADVSATAAIAYSKLALTGNIVDADISATAAIADTKLATISTSGKVDNSATTATASNTANTIVLRDSNGDFSAGEITADVAYDNTTSGLTATTVQGAIDEIAASPAASVDYFTATVEGSGGTSDWDDSSMPVVAVLSVPGILSTDRPTVGLDLSNVNVFFAANVAASFQTIYRVEATDNDELTLYATSEPVFDFDLLIQVVR